jgi:sulfate transport system permease protein
VCTSRQALHSYEVSFGLSLIAALLNGFFGLVTAWVLERYAFFGKRIVNALIDLPFAVPTSVAGIALTQIYASNGGYLGQFFFNEFGWRIAYTQVGMVIALAFVGFPFVVRTLQPVIANLSADQEEAAACLGANRVQTLFRIILPALVTSWITGIMLAFGRAVGEYGSIVFISGNRPLDTEITPRLIIAELDQFDYTAGAGLGVTMLVISFSVVGLVNYLQSRNHEIAPC